ncbi:double-stranded DNA-binding domain-containing protein [Entophlyctis helioformis]|nr:double-stranded DNA-binding domain-containing protein [Entophlyctis helioformis]
MRGQQGSASGGLPGIPSSMMGGQGGNRESAEEAAAKKSDMEEMRRNMLYQILDNQARERLARISIVKADKARAVEDMLLRMAQSGQLRSKVNESQLIDFLGQISGQQQTTTKITYNRRKDDDESDEDWDL